MLASEAEGVQFYGTKCLNLWDLTQYPDVDSVITELNWRIPTQGVLRTEDMLSGTGKTHTLEIVFP